MTLSLSTLFRLTTLVCVALGIAPHARGFVEQADPVLCGLAVVAFIAAVAAVGAVAASEL